MEIPKRFINFIDKVVFKYLQELYTTSIKKQEYKIINDLNWVTLSNTILGKEFGLSPFQIRECLKRLESIKLIQIRFGQARERFFIIRKNCYEEIIVKLKNMSDEKLSKLNEYIDKELNNE